MISSGQGADMMSVEHKRKLNHKHDVLCEEMMPHFILTSLKSDRWVQVTNIISDR